MTKKKDINTGTKQLLAQIDQNVGIITLNRPESRNALSDELTPALRTTIKEFDTNREVRSLLITGAGKAFCAGGDVKSMSQGGIGPKLARKEAIEDLQKKQLSLTGALYNFTKPSIAALPGPAAGAGLSIALACDIRYVSNNAFAIAGYGRIALSGDYGITWLLSKTVGLSKAKELMFTNDKISAEEGLRIGLFNKIIEEKELYEATFDAARNMARFSPLALSLMKKNLNNSNELNFIESLNKEAACLIDTARSNDHKEGIKAFVEKRKPKFTGN
jgi:enoyl-CoA hydratase/carnithine racemase